MSQDPACLPRRPGDWLRVATPEPGYADRVVADITRITRTKPGRALLEQIRDSGRNISIEKPGAIDPPNAWVQPRDVAAAAGGRGCDCAVIYDPRAWPNAVHSAVPSSDVLLFNLLRHALAQLRGAAPALDAGGEIALTALDALVDYREAGRDGA